MFNQCDIRGRRFVPARFSAPLAGYTHSPFRRLLSELGGCGAIWTEMLAARQTLGEDFRKSPWLRNNPSGPVVFYQLMVCAGDPLERIMNRLGNNGVEAVDLNLACDAPSIRAHNAGRGLFDNLGALKVVANEMRRHWPGILTAKLRLGTRMPGWETRFAERVLLLENAGFDALVIHFRFFEDKFKRRARHDLVEWATGLTRLPVIANGDIGALEDLLDLGAQLRSASAIMIGRQAVVRPWLFANWESSRPIDYGGVWLRLFRDIQEAFPPETALRRVRMFTKYFAANFAFGHNFAVDVAKAECLEQAKERAASFFARGPQVLSRPTAAGL